MRSINLIKFILYISIFGTHCVWDGTNKIKYCLILSWLLFYKFFLQKEALALRPILLLLKQTDSETSGFSCRILFVVVKVIVVTTTAAATVCLVRDSKFQREQRAATAAAAKSALYYFYTVDFRLCSHLSSIWTRASN